MTRRPRLSLGAGVLAACALASCSSALAAPVGTAALATRGSTDLGRFVGPRAVVLVLNGRHPGQLRALLARPHHAVLSPSAFLARYAPSADSVNAVAGWAREHRLSVTSVSSDRALVNIRGASGPLGRALGIHFDSFRSAGGAAYVSSVGTARLPRVIAARVKAIVGLSDLGRLHTSSLARRAQLAGKLGGLPVIGPSGVPSAAPALPVVSTGTPNYPASYTPQQFWSLYNAPAANTGTGQQVSVIAAGNVSQPKTDLVTFEKQFGLPAVTWNQIDVGTPSSDTSGSDEWDLDTQYSTGFAPGVSQVNVYVGPSLSNADILNTIDKWVTTNATKQASFSAGECESLASVSGFESSLDGVLAQAVAQGQTLFTSSGDTGSQCPALVAQNGVPAGEPGDNYPAASPNAIGVGGTTVLTNGPTNEVAWFAGGGGTSLTENAPAFQAAAGGSFLGVSRGVPDVSLDADPNSGYDVIVAGQQMVIGGTSASAPAWQGIWARAQGAHQGGLGFAGPVIYATEPPGAFHDITLGANGLYAATPGWDYVTGRGTPDITAFVNGA